MSATRDATTSLILGAQGMGKTVLMKYLAWCWNRQNGPLLVIDPSHVFHEYGSDILQDGPSLDPRDQGMIIDGWTRALQYFVYYMARGALVFDDMDACMGVAPKQYDVIRTFRTQSRHAIGDVFCSGRRLLMPKDVLMGASFIYCMNMGHIESQIELERMSSRPGLARRIGQLKKLECLKINMKDSSEPVGFIDMRTQILPHVIAWENAARAAQTPWPEISMKKWAQRHTALAQAKRTA